MRDHSEAGMEPVTIMKEWAFEDVDTIFSILIMIYQLYFWLPSKFGDFLQKSLHQARKKFYFPLFAYFEMTLSRSNALFKTFAPLKALLHPLLSFCFLVVSLFLKENKSAKLAIVHEFLERVSSASTIEIGCPSFVSLFTTKYMMPNIILFFLVMILFCRYELQVISKTNCVGNGRCR